MNKYIKILLILLLLALVINESQRKTITQFMRRKQEASRLAPPPQRSPTTGFKLDYCHDSNLRIVFLCDYRWEKKLTDPGTMIYVMETDPLIYFTVIRINAEIQMIRQLGPDRLEALNRYQEGFAIEETRLAGEEAIKVKAFAKEDPDTRLLDYYFIRDNFLYGVMFSIKPKDKWNVYQSTFQDVVNAMHFLKG